MNRLQPVENTPTAVAVVGKNLTKIDPYLVGRMDIIEVYGAKGDGLTDDTAAFQGAVAALDRLELPSGYTFLIGPITITKPKFQVRGVGGMAIIRAKPASNGDVLTFDGTNSGGGYFKLIDVELYGDKTQQASGNGLVLRNASYAWVEHCIIADAKENGVVIENQNGSSNADEINLTNCRIFSNGQDGIRLLMTGSPQQAPGDHVITGNHINYSGRHGIYAEPGYATLIQGNNILTNGGAGIKLVHCYRFVVEGNQVRYNGLQGGYLDGCSNCVVSNNQWHLNNRGGSGVNLDVWNSSNSTIGGNYCGDDDFTPVNLYGLQLADSTNMRLACNVLKGLTAGANIARTTFVAQGNVGLKDNDGHVTPFYYGAKGDGTTDDTAAIQAQINASDSLFLPAGYTFIVENLSIQNHNYPNRPFRIFGGGCLKLKPGATHLMLYVYNCDDMTIDGVEFDGNKANQTHQNWGLYLVNVNYSSIHNCFVHDHSGTAIVLSRTAPGLCDENEISRNRIIKNGGHGIYIENGGDHGLANNHIGWNDWDGVQCVGCYTIAIVGNHVLSNTHHGINIAGSGRFVISDNQIRENKRHGIVMDAAAGHKLNSNRIIWNGVEVENTYDGVNMTNCAEITVVGNSINDYAWASAGWPVNGRNTQRYGLFASGCTNLLLCGNNLAPNNTDSAHLMGGSYAASCNRGLADFPPSSAMAAGPLSPEDWTRFNGKQDLIPPGESGQFLRGNKAWSKVGWIDLDGVPSSFPPAAHTQDWATITGAPSAYPPTAHAHIIADTTGLQTALESREPELGNPAATGYVLSSTSAGVRGWVEPPTGFPGFGGGGSANTASRSDHAHDGYEPVLGNPGCSGSALVSTDAGVRSWVVTTGNASAATLVLRDSSGSANFNICLAVRVIAGDRIDTPVVQNDATGGVIALKVNSIVVGTFTLNGLEIPTGKVLKGVYHAADGTPGISAPSPKTWLDAEGNTHAVTLKNGLITDWTITP